MKTFRVQVSRALILVVVALWGSSSLSATGGESIAPALNKEESRFKVSSALYHMMSPKEDESAVTEFEAGLSYKISPSVTLGVGSAFRKLYEIDLGQNEMVLDDLLFYSTFKFDLIRDLKTSLRIGTTTPNSQVSQDEGITTKPNARLVVQKGLMGEKLVLTYLTQYTYYLSEYTTLRSGAPMNDWVFRNTLGLDYEVFDGLGLSASISHYFTQENQVVQGVLPSNKGDYIIDISASYQLNSSVAVGLGLYQSDSYLRPGTYEAYIYDPASSRIYLSLSASTP